MQQINRVRGVRLDTKVGNYFLMIFSSSSIIALHRTSSSSQEIIRGV